MVRMFNELKLTVEQTSHRKSFERTVEKNSLILEEMTAEIRKLQTVVSLIKNSVDKMKNSRGALNSRINS